MLVCLTLQALARSIPTSFVVESTSVAGPGFVNIAISNIWIEKVHYKLLFPSCTLYTRSWWGRCAVQHFLFVGWSGCSRKMICAWLVLGAL